jgi:hypothetical protein
MALSLLLFSLLLGGGIGSLLTSVVGRGRSGAGAAVALAVALLIVVLALLFPKLYATGIDPRIATLILTLPVGILMGCPFPLAIRGLGVHGFERHTAVMWGVNGVASVFGSALAMTIGISWGFSRALFAGAALYVAVAALFMVLDRARRSKLGVVESGQ